MTETVFSKKAMTPQKTGLAFVFALLAVATIFLSGCLNQPQAGGMSYMEIAREQPGCEGGWCSTEYIVLSNGLTFVRKLADGESVPSFQFGKIGLQDAASLIDTAQAYPTKGNSCQDCKSYHIYSFSNASIVSFKSSTQDEWDRAAILQGQAETSAANMTAGDGFFVHLIYMPAGKDIVDYHVFSDGTVLLEYFDLNLNVVNARIFQLDSQKLSQVRAVFFGEKITAEPEQEPGCAQSGIIFAYMESYSAGEFLLTNTCGLSNSASAQAFRNVRNILEDLA